MGKRIIIVVLVLGAIAWMSEVALRGLRKDPRFLARPTHMEAGGPDWGGSEVVRPVLVRLRQLGPINLFDRRFDERVRVALLQVPGVARVHDVRRLWPRRYTVSFAMHRPVAIVHHEDERIPVTADGVVLPGEPYKDAVHGLLRIRGVHEHPPIPGKRWSSGSLRDGIATVLQLEPHRERIAPLGIDWVDVSGAYHSRLGVVLYGAHDISVRWGRPRADLGENPVPLKIEFLESAVRKLDRARGRELDVRFDEMYESRTSTP
ncbi:MAG: hypothetical protein OER88_14245 [Planctomycetota bacterium]|nr:hypothetical protein [Planctomycetota bacterium]